jgi:hypothetical protein
VIEPRRVVGQVRSFVLDVDEGRPATVWQDGSPLCCVCHLTKVSRFTRPGPDGLPICCRCADDCMEEWGWMQHPKSGAWVELDGGEDLRGLLRVFNVDLLESSGETEWRTCADCEQSLPLERFDRVKGPRNLPGARMARCKRCRARDLLGPPVEPPIPDGMKQCRQCKRILDEATGFQRRPSGKAASWCTRCTSAAHLRTPSYRAKYPGAGTGSGRRVGFKLQR